MSTKPDILELESLRSELIENTLSTTSNNLRLFFYLNYFEKILSLNNSNLEEAFLKEFIDDYITCISRFEVWGVEPEISHNILKRLKYLATLKTASENLTALNSEFDRIKNQSEKLSQILEGKEIEDGEPRKAFFPLIDRDAPAGFYGIIEAITVRINKSADKDKFIIVPSEKEVEKKILEQCEESWKLALNLSKKFVRKPGIHHEIIISFDKKEGIYEGNSLGIALTLSFLEQLLKFYNPVYIINIKEHSAFTGGVKETGEVLCTSEEIIKRKVAAAFFSEINTFVLPKCEETYAFFALTQLKNNHPDRKLKLIPVEDITDVLNRRDVVDIKKQKIVVRSGKFLRKNWVFACIICFLLLLVGYFFVADLDTNPSFLSVDGRFVYVKNNGGNTLWKKEIAIGKLYIENEKLFKKWVKVVDINSDGINEVLIREGANIDQNDNHKFGSISCFSFDGKVIWNYVFQEITSSVREDLNEHYTIIMIDTVTINNKKLLVAAASNWDSFSSAIIKIDLKTGKLVDNILWCSGHTIDGHLKDLDSNGVKDFIGLGYDNGYEQVVLWGSSLDQLSGFRPTTQEYTILHQPQTKLLFYIRVPKTDYETYMNFRTSSIAYDGFTDVNSKRKYIYSNSANLIDLYQAVTFELDYNLKDFNLIIGSIYRVIRDSLVAQGKLAPPYSDTQEYKNIIKEGILYWKNGIWVKRIEMD